MIYSLFNVGVLQQLTEIILEPLQMPSNTLLPLLQRVQM